MSIPVGPTGSIAGMPELGWAAAASARAFGVRFGIRVNDASLLPKLLDRLPPGSRACNDAGDNPICYSVVKELDPVDAQFGAGWQVFAGTQLEARTRDQIEALEVFEGLVRFDVAQHATRWTFVHAGAVGWNGRAILIPGRSLSGKSRLVQALVRAGATYYSDEYAVLDRRGRLYPFAKPLTIRRADGATDRVTANELGGTPGTRSLSVGMVVSTSYVPGAVWNPSSVSPGAGMLALLENTPRAQEAPARVMIALAGAAGVAVTLKGPRGEAEATADELLNRAMSWHSPLRDIA